MAEIPACRRADRTDFYTPPSLALLINALIAADRLLVPYVPHHLLTKGCGS